MMRIAVKIALILVGIGILSNPVFCGTWTDNQFIYKPNLGARGYQEKALFDAALDRIDTRLGKEVWVGDPKYGDTIQAVVTAIGSNPALLKIPAGTYAISDDLTIPANVALRFERGAIFDIVDAKTLTINGSLEAGLWQIFSGNGNVVLAAGKIPQAYFEWWGAAGDGSTDDYQAINAALIAASGKTTVKVTPGKTFISGTRITLPSNTTLRGGGTIKAKPLVGSSHEGFIYAVSQSGIRVEGITIDCNPSSQTHTGLSGIFLNGCTDFVFRNNTVVCSYSGLNFRGTGAARADISNNFFDHDNIAASSTQPGMGVVVQADDVVISNNRFLMQDISSADQNIHTAIVAGSSAEAAGPWYRITVTGNVIYRGYTGIAVGNIHAGTVTGNSISHCKTASHSQGIYLSYSQNCSVTGNSIYNMDYGSIALVDCNDCAIVGNNILNDVEGANPLYTYGISVSYAVAMCNRNIVANNVIKGIENTTGGSTSTGIIFYCDDGICSNNIIINGAGGVNRGIVATGNNNIVNFNRIECTNHCIYVISTASGNKFAENTLKSSGTYAIYDASTGTNEWRRNKLLAGGYTESQAQFRTDDQDREVIVRKTADYTLVPADGGKRFTNTGATGIITLSLPAIIQGTTYSFTRTATYAIHIDPYGTQVIRGGGAGKYLSLDSDGASVTLRCDLSNTWEIVSTTGTISFE